MRIITLSQLSLAGSSGIAEAKIPLWWADGGSVGNTGNTAGGSNLLADGGVTGIASQSKTNLFTLSSSWNASLKFAFEATISINSSGFTAYAELWDITSNTGVIGSQINTTSQSDIVLRSNQFTLTPSHVYGVTFWNSSTNTVYITDASLIIFPS